MQSKLPPLDSIKIVRPINLSPIEPDFDKLDRKVLIRDLQDQDKLPKGEGQNFDHLSNEQLFKMLVRPKPGGVFTERYQIKTIQVDPCDVLKKAQEQGVTIPAELKKKYEADCDEKAKCTPTQPSV